MTSFKLGESLTCQQSIGNFHNAICVSPPASGNVEDMRILCPAVYSEQLNI